MTVTESRLREVLTELADEAQPVPLLHRLDRRMPAADRRRRLVITAVAAATAVVVAASAGLVWSWTTSMPQPAHQPVEVFELDTVRTTRPGRAWFVVTLAGSNHVAGNEIPAFVAPAGSGRAVLVPPSTARPTPFAQRLSADGTRLTRFTQTNLDPAAVEVLDLTTGEIRGEELGPALDGFVYAAELSPDNGTVAIYLDGQVRVVDVGTGAATTVHRQPIWDEFDSFSPGVGWSPEGTRLAVHDEADLLVLDRAGQLLQELVGTHLVNGSQSWSPDGESVIGYDVARAQFQIVPVDGGSRRELEPPAGAIRPLGWAGDRVVWLAGDPGDQRLLTADDDGADARTWLRFEVGDVPVESVTWSRDLSG